MRSDLYLILKESIVHFQSAYYFGAYSYHTTGSRQQTTNRRQKTATNSREQQTAGSSKLQAAVGNKQQTAVDSRQQQIGRQTSNSNRPDSRQHRQQTAIDSPRMSRSSWFAMLAINDRPGESTLVSEE